MPDFVTPEPRVRARMVLSPMRVPKAADLRRATIRAHESIARAIRERDGAAALRRMTRHVRSYAAEAVKGEQTIAAGRPTP